MTGSTLDLLPSGQNLLPTEHTPPPLAPPAAPAERPIERTGRFTFTGRGSEYFRIWIVNLLLTLVTLGIYSAWAKVRKTRYFWTNTQYDGHTFDFHGKPFAILRGRIVGVGLLLAYTFSFEISPALGIGTLVALGLVGPWLFLKAQQFKLRNTSHRGLRFDFDASLADSYKMLLPGIALWLAFAGVSSVLGARFAEGTAEEPPWRELAVLYGALGLWLLMFPWLHARLKRFQHGHARFADAPFEYAVRTRTFYAIYGIALLIFVVALAILIGGMTVTSAAAGLFGAQRDGAGVMVVVLFVIAAVVAYGIPFAYGAARVFRTVWNGTSFGRASFHSEVTARGYVWLAAKNTLLTVVTLGLYWPFAAVALARYKVERMSTIGDPDLDSVVASAATNARVTAAGEGAADLFGLDIGL